MGMFSDRPPIRKKLIRLNAAELKDRDLPVHVRSTGWKYFPAHVDESGNKVPATFYSQFDTSFVSSRAVLSRDLDRGHPLLNQLRRNLNAQSVMAMYSLAECLEEKARELRRWCWEREGK